MKTKVIEGRCYKSRKQKGLFRMKKKSLEELQIDRYNKTVSDFYGEAHCTELLKILRAELKESREELALERSQIIHAPEENPAVWLAREYKGLYVAL
jgi:hypothetical protein